MQMPIAAERDPERSLAKMGRAVLALLLLIVAVANMVTALGAQPWQPAGLVEQIVDLDGLGWGRVGVVTTASLLLLVARALARGKRQAWLLAVCLLTLSLILETLEGARTHSMLVVLALLAVLLALAPLFPTRSDTRATVRGYAALALGGWLTWGHTFLFHIARAGLWQAPYLPIVPLLLVARLLTYAILGYGVLQLLSPALWRRCAAGEERERADAVIARYGWMSTVYFARGADKSYFWSASGRSLIAYRVTLGVALALSGPIGPVEECEETVRGFIAYCRKQDWQVAFYQTTSEVKVLCRRMGMHAIKIGEDPIVELDRFTLQGKIGAPVRHSVARARRGGLSVRIFQGEPLPEAIFVGMKRISAAWLHEQKASIQFGYSMGRFPLDWNEELLTAVALGPDGETQAFVTWTPLYAGDGWALDNMRRAATTEPGAMELLLAESIAWAKEHGSARMTLGLVPLAGIGAPSADVSCMPSGPSDALSHSGLVSSSPATSASLLERSAAYLHRRGLLLGNYRSLHAFKAKFQVQWHPRYLVVGELSALPQVLSALAVAMGVGWRGVLGDAWEALRGGRGFSTRATALDQTALSTAAVPTAQPVEPVAVAANDEASA